MRQGLRQRIALAAPSGLWNSTTAPQALATRFAQDLTNMIPTRAGTIAKRFGTLNLGEAALPNDESILEIGEYPKSDGTFELFVYSDAGIVYKYDEVADTYTPQITGLSTDGLPFFNVFQGKLLLCNGVDDFREYDGTSWSIVQEFVREQAVKLVVDEDTLTVSTSEDLSARYAAGSELEVQYRILNEEISSLTRSSTTATATTANDHNLSTGDFVIIANTTEDNFNGRHEITVTGVNTFTYEVADTGSTTATVFAEPIKAVLANSAPKIAYNTGFTKENNIFASVALTSQAVRATATPKRTVNNTTSVDETTGEEKTTIAANFTVEYRDVLANGDWVEFGSFSGSVTRGDDIIFEAEGLTPSLYEARFVGAKTNLLELTMEFQEITDDEGRDYQGKVVEAASLARTTDTATFTATSDHGLATDDVVFIYDVAQPEYAGAHKITVTSSTAFTFKVANEPTTPATPSANLPSTINYSTGRITKTVEVDSTSFASGAQTINLTASAFPASENVEITRLKYYDKPPAFRYIHVSQDRLWALGPGIYKANEFIGDDTRNFVYFPDIRNSTTGWFNQNLQQVPYINASSVQEFGDSLVAVQEFAGTVALMGQRGVYLYGGNDPTRIDGFAFVKRIPVGAIHPKLIQELPNDVAYVTRYGIRSLAYTNINAEIQSSPDIGSAIDPSVNDQISRLLSDDATYRTARSFFHPQGGLYGFKMATEVHVFSVQEEQRGWSRFLGDFTSATALYGSQSRRLIMALDGQLARYADGRTAGTTLSYADRGEDIVYSWWTPWLQIQGKRFGIRAYQLMVTSETESTTLMISRLRDNNIGSAKENTVTTTPPVSFWDEAFWDESFWDGGTRIPVTVDKAICYNMSFVVRGKDQVGPVEITNLEIFGQLEDGR